MHAELFVLENNNMNMHRNFCMHILLRDCLAYVFSIVLEGMNILAFKPFM